MKKLKKIAVLGILILNFVFTTSVFAAEYWSRQWTIDVGCCLSSEYGADNGVAFEVKTTYGDRASFYTHTRTSWTAMSLRVVNDNKASRSDWAGTEEHVVYNPKTTASYNFLYNMQVRSALNQIGTDTIMFQWSPDQLDRVSGF